MGETIVTVVLLALLFCGLLSLRFFSLRGKRQRDERQNAPFPATNWNMEPPSWRGPPMAARNAIAIKPRARTDREPYAEGKLQSHTAAEVTEMFSGLRPALSDAQKSSQTLRKLADRYAETWRANWTAFEAAVRSARIATDQAERFNETLNELMFRDDGPYDKYLNLINSLEAISYDVDNCVSDIEFTRDEIVMERQHKIARYRSVGLGCSVQERRGTAG